MRLHFLNDVVDDVESTGLSIITSILLVKRMNKFVNR